jgi:hypothetical protein
MLNTIIYALLHAAILVPVLASPVTAQAQQDDSNDLAKYNQTIFLPYLDAFTSLRTPIISGNIGGRSFQLPVDTGSTGILVGAPKLPEISTSDGEPGYQFLITSGNLHVGRWVDVAVTFFGNKMEQAVARVPILIVDKSWKCPEYKEGVDKDECPNKDAVKNDINNIVIMGVGFGHGPEPKYNPFLNVNVLNKKDVTDNEFRAGYYIGKDGVYLGLTPINTANAAWVGLDAGPSGDKHDWKMVKTTFTVDSAGPYSGNAVIDTGIAEMHLQALPSANGIPNTLAHEPDHPEMDIRVAKPGIKLKFGFPALGDQNVAGYGFTVGDKKFPSQPYYVRAVSDRSGAFVDTGRKFLWGFSIAFDAVGGRYGFICLRCNDGAGGSQDE